MCAVKAPGFGENRKANLQDIAALTGGQVRAGFGCFKVLGFRVYCIALHQQGYECVHVQLSMYMYMARAGVLPAQIACSE